MTRTAAANAAATRKISLWLLPQQQLFVRTVHSPILLCSGFGTWQTACMYAVASTASPQKSAYGGTTTHKALMDIDLGLSRFGRRGVLHRHEHSNYDDQARFIFRVLNGCRRGQVGNSPRDQFGSSDRTAELIDDEVHRLISERYEASRSILDRRHSQLERIARELIQKETLDRPALEQLLQEELEHS